MTTNVMGYNVQAMLDLTAKVLCHLSQSDAMVYVSGAVEAFIKGRGGDTGEGWWGLYRVTHHKDARALLCD